MAPTIWIDGQYYDKANAKVSVFDHGLSVYAQLYVALGRAEPAEQLVAETFDQAWRAAGEFHPHAGSVLVWLSSLARSLATRRGATPAVR